MLVLSRKAGETVVAEINGIKVRFTFIKYADGKARVGIEAPQQVGVYREELKQAAAEEPQTCS